MRFGFCLVVVMVVFDQWGGQKEENMQPEKTAGAEARRLSSTELKGLQAIPCG